MIMSAKRSVAADFVRALRLPFVTASVLPFLAGCFLAPLINLPLLLIGLLAVAATHLSANVINDYADSRSGVDWQDPSYYGGLFSGSKLIQEGRFTERSYLIMALALAGISLACSAVISYLHHNLWVLFLHGMVVALAWSYSTAPARLSYRYAGEAVVFLLFGPAAVLAGQYVQTGILVTAEACLLSLPFAFLTVAVLVANEIPDYQEDQAAGKHNLTHLTALPRAFVLYYAMAGGALAAIMLAVTMAVLRSWTMIALLSVPLVLATGDVLRQNYMHKARLTLASKLTIAVHSLVGLIIVIDLLLS